MSESLSTRRIVVRFAVAFASMVIVFTAKADTQNIDELTNFSRICGPARNSGLTFHVTFAPLRDLAPGDAPRYGTWEYAYETDEQQYPGNTYTLSNEREDRIELVSTLPRPAPGTQLPAYIWHVISVPTPPGRGAGYVARYEEFFDEQDVWDNSTYLTLQRSVDPPTLLFVDQNLPEGVLSDITTIWMDTFTETAMDQLVLRSFESPGLYTHTFIYQQMPGSVDDINDDVGDRRNSSRAVHLNGMAFGLVLDPEGNCLASTSLDLVTED